MTAATHGGPRAVVVDDSHFMRTVISDILQEGGIEVVGEAADGAEAVRAVEECDPDIVTMDVEMPRVDGIEATERIMDAHPTPILMLSAHTDDGADVTFDALQRGAVDFFTKPGGEVSVEMTRFEDKLVEKVHTVAASDVARTNGSADPDTTAPVAATAGDVGADATVVIGSSTGGPGVVERVLSELPPADARIVVVQHMPEEFTGRFAERLDEHSAYAVREASDGDRVGPGGGVVAPGGYHLTVPRYRSGRLGVELTEDPPVNGVRPAIDVTMESIAGTVEGELVAVVLTGMGRDGAAGARAIKDAGGTVIVQDEPTSAVFGMPKRTIETGCVDAVLPEADIAAGITDALEP